jgi:anti-sigma regulatory factor (Ser/Thr protein kinase)
MTIDDVRDPSVTIEKLVLITVPCDARAPATVRAQLSNVEPRASSVGDVLLVASELVTNAVRHSGCSPEDELLVRVSVRPDLLLISVQDPGRSGLDAARVDPGAGERPGGWGLNIVERLSRTWGTARGEGYCVWAELADERQVASH